MNFVRAAVATCLAWSLYACGAQPEPQPASRTDAGTESCQVQDSRPGSGGADEFGLEHTYRDVLAAYFGENVKSGRQTLKRGLFGTLAVNEAELAVVVDPTQVNVAALQSDLDAASDGESRAVVRDSCHRADELVAVYESVSAGEAGADRASGWSVDPVDSTLRVTFSEAEGAAAERLQRAHGDLVTVEFAKGESVLD